MNFLQLVTDLNRVTDLKDHLRHPLKRPELTDININEPSTKQPSPRLKAMGLSVTYQTTRY